MMVWSFQYQPKPDSYPNSEPLGGGYVRLVLEDDTLDGGGGLRGNSQASSGRRVKPESVPKVIRWLSSRRLLDFEASNIFTVSDRLRALIEELEPGVHQFEPVQFIAKNGSDLSTRWFWQICNRLDSVNREHTNYFLRDGRGTWWAPSKDLVPLHKQKLYFDLKSIEGTKFWHDKHILSTNFCTDRAKLMLEQSNITGIKFNRQNQI